MKLFCKSLFLLGIAVLILTSTISCYAGDLTTFESFYKGSSSIDWAIGCALAIACGAAVYFSGGLASPLIAGPITWIGGLIGGIMGLSGAAATSAGLALLGGGAVTAGGLGMAGGTALLTAAYTFGTGAFVDYGIGKVMAEYSYHELQEQTKELPNLPPFVNSEGPAVVGNAVKIFKNKYNYEAQPGSEFNQIVCRDVSAELEQYQRPEKHFYTFNYDQKIDEELARLYSAQAIVGFMLSDFKLAYDAANNALKTNYEGSFTVAKNIASSAGYIIGEIDKKISVQYFTDSITAEPDNKLIPLLYSMYISRVGSANLLDADLLESISLPIQTIENVKMNEAVRQILFTSYISHIKICQSNIITLNHYRDDNDFDLKELQLKSNEYFVQYKKMISNLKIFLAYSFKSKNSDSLTKTLIDNLTVANEYANDIDRLEKLNQETMNTKRGGDVNEKTKQDQDYFTT